MTSPVAGSIRRTTLGCTLAAFRRRISSVFPGFFIPRPPRRHSVDNMLSFRGA
jgi:hypothetical protein